MTKEKFMKKYSFPFLHSCLAVFTMTVAVASINAYAGPPAGDEEKPKTMADQLRSQFEEIKNSLSNVAIFSSPPPVTNNQPPQGNITGNGNPPGTATQQPNPTTTGISDHAGVTIPPIPENTPIPGNITQQQTGQTVITSGNVINTDGMKPIHHYQRHLVSTGGTGGATGNNGVAGNNSTNNSSSGGTGGSSGSVIAGAPYNLTGMGFGNAISVLTTVNAFFPQFLGAYNSPQGLEISPVSGQNINSYPQYVMPQNPQGAGNFIISNGKKVALFTFATVKNGSLGSGTLPTLLQYVQIVTGLSNGSITASNWALVNGICTGSVKDPYDNTIWSIANAFFQPPFADVGTIAFPNTQYVDHVARIIGLKYTGQDLSAYDVSNAADCAGMANESNPQAICPQSVNGQTFVMYLPSGTHFPYSPTVGGSNEAGGYVAGGPSTSYTTLSASSGGTCYYNSPTNIARTFAPVEILLDTGTLPSTTNNCTPPGSVITINGIEQTYVGLVNTLPWGTCYSLPCSSIGNTLIALNGVASSANYANNPDGYCQYRNNQNENNPIP